MSRLHSFVLVFIGVFAILLTGCNPRAVESLIVNAPETLETNQSGEFSATANETARPPISYSWNFGDGVTTDGTAVAHAFIEPGSYTVTVTASNRNGRYSISNSANVLVMNPPVPAQVIALLSSSVDVDTRTLSNLVPTSGEMLHLPTPGLLEMALLRQTRGLNTLSRTKVCTLSCWNFRMNTVGMLEP